MGYPGGLKVITGVLSRGRREGQSQRERDRLEDVTLPALKMEEGSVSQGAQVAPEAGEDRGADSSFKSSEGVLPC